MSPSSPYRAPEPHIQPVIITTGADIPDHRVVLILGVVHGFALRAQPELGSRTVQQAFDARRTALAGLVAEASTLKAHGVIGLRYDSNDSDVVAYGTAVRLERSAP